MDTCYLCGKKPWSDRAGYGFSIHQCDRCDEDVCENCADMDADCDQDGFFITQWICAGGCKSTALVPYDSRFLRFDWGTVADAAEQALINECKKLGARMRETTAMVKEAIKELAA